MGELKFNNGLDAINFIKEMPHANGFKIKDYATDVWEFIEKNLEDYESLKKEYNQLMNKYQDLDKKYYKEHKALSIIKEKDITPSWVLAGNNLFEYNLLVSDKEKLSEDQFYTLKGCLEHGK